MPSRINIGPEDGPYIAINENNGDIELEDNTGAVVAKWDDGQSQWDFVGNDISGVGAFDSESVNTGEVIIGGTLYQEDANSPFVVDDEESATYAVAGDYDELIIIPDREDPSHTNMRINEIDTEDYDYLKHNGTQVDGATSFDFLRIRNYQYIVLIHDQFPRDDDIRIGAVSLSKSSDSIVGGLLGSVGEGINSFTVFEDGSSRDFSARVFGRSMDI